MPAAVGHGIEIARQRAPAHPGGRLSPSSASNASKRVSQWPVDLQPTMAVFTPGPMTGSTASFGLPTRPAACRYCLSGRIDRDYLRQPGGQGGYHAIRELGEAKSPDCE